MCKNVLIVEDSLYTRTLIKNTLESGGFEVIGQASTGEEAIDLARRLQPDVITLDNILPDMWGTDVLKIYSEEGLSSKVIMVSAVGQELIVNECMQLGAFAYIVKPFTPEELLGVLNKIHFADQKG